MDGLKYGSNQAKWGETTGAKVSWWHVFRKTLYFSWASKSSQILGKWCQISLILWSAVCEGRTCAGPQRQQIHEDVLIQFIRQDWGCCFPPVCPNGAVQKCTTTLHLISVGRKLWLQLLSVTIKYENTAYYTCRLDFMLTAHTHSKTISFVNLRAGIAKLKHCVLYNFHPSKVIFK